MNAIVFGNVTLDIICYPINEVPRHESISFDDVTVSPGGCGSNTAIGLASMGVPTGIVARTGDDDSADLLFRYWARVGVDPHFVQRTAEKPTGTSVGLIDDNFQPRFIHTSGANRGLTAEAIDPQAFAQAGTKFFHIAGFFVLPNLFAAVGAKLAELRSLGIRTSLDVVFNTRMDDPNLRNALWECLPHLDYFIANDHEAFRLTDERDPARAAAFLRDRGAKSVIVKLGAAGCYALSDEFAGVVPAFKVEVVDTTGAGDAFAAGFIAALSQGKNLRIRARCRESGRSSHRAKIRRYCRLGRSNGEGKMSIVVFGSINMDLVVRTPRLPSVGETLTGHSFSTSPGGKGANQAVACARLGVQTRMVGSVGGDVFGAALRENLASTGVDTTYVSTDADVASGVALIAVDDHAENNIIVVSGANGSIGEADLRRLEQALDQASLLLLQLEIPLEMVTAAAKIAQQKKVFVILDPAPARQLPNELYPLIDILTPNENEAAMLVGFPVNDRKSAEQAAQSLFKKGVSCVIIKMSAKGIFALDSQRSQFYPAIPVTAIDTVAAGDAFNGALAVAFSEGQPFDEAIYWGLAGGALAVTKTGAQEAMPAREELLDLLKNIKQI